MNDYLASFILDAYLFCKNIERTPEECVHEIITCYIEEGDDELCKDRYVGHVKPWSSCE